MLKRVMSFLWRKKWLIAALVVVIGGWLFWQGRQSAQKKIVTIKPEYRDIVETLNVSGKVDAEEKARMTFAGASKLMWLPIKEGDVVKKWQGLAQVDARALANQMQIAQNNHGKQFRTFENTLDAVDYYSDSGLTQTERRAAESAQLDIRNSALTVESADIAVKLAFMSSPINGVVTQIDQKNVGAVMMPTDTIQIVNPSTVFFSAVVDEQDIGKVTASQAATITLDAFTDQAFEAKIKRIAFTPSLSESGGTGYQVWLTLPVDNSQMRYKLGMNGEANIILAKKANVLSISVDALVERDGKEYVDVEKQGKVDRVEVTTGIRDSNYVEILTGITADDAIVVPTSK